MADISTEIAEIQEASYGSEVRQSIVDGLNKVNAGTLPAVSASDAGKFLTVNNNGQWEVRGGGLVPTPTGTKNITENGTHDVTNYASANVDVEPDLGTKNITQNGTYNASSDDLDGYSSVVVNVQGGGGGTIEPLSVTQNGTYTPPSGVDGYAPVVVNVSGGEPHGHSLPSEYQEVEYIHCNGDSYAVIELPTQIDDSLLLCAVVSADNVNVSEQGFIGCYPDQLNTNDTLFEFYFSNNAWNLYVSTSTHDSYGIHSDSDKFYYMYAGLSSMKMSKFLVGRYRTDAYSFYGKIKKFEVKKQFGEYPNNNLIAQVIPCYRKNDSVIGFYETVNGTFNTNQGSVPFTKGPDI